MTRTREIHRTVLHIPPGYTDYDPQDPRIDEIREDPEATGPYIGRERWFALPEDLFEDADPEELEGHIQAYQSAASPPDKVDALFEIVMEAHNFDREDFLDGE